MDWKEQYTEFQGEFTRATADIDLLARMTSNDTKNIEAIFRKILSIQADDALRYDFTKY